MTPDCKWASSTSAVSPPLFCRRSLALFKTPTAQTVPSSDLLPPWLTFPSPSCRCRGTPQSPARLHPAHTLGLGLAGSQPGPQPGPVSAPSRGQALHACSSCLLIPPPLLCNLHWKNNKENKNSLSTLILESSPPFSVPRGCQSMCPPRGFKLFALSVWKAPPLAPCMGALLAIQVSP